MSVSAGSLGMFVNATGKWLSAIERCDHTDARFFANEVRVAAKLLAIDPEFKRRYAAVCSDGDGPDPEAAIEIVGALINAITEVARTGDDPPSANEPAPSAAFTPPSARAPTLPLPGSPPP